MTMPKRTAEAHWHGSLQEGSGTIKLGSGSFEGPYSFTSRFENGPGTNPEELLGAAEAGCFTMALASALTRAEHPPTSLDTTATVVLERGESGFRISKIALRTVGQVPDMAEEDFQAMANEAKRICPLSRALASTDITLDATLES
jgi:osmotically inducible protein OsmC